MRVRTQLIAAFLGLAVVPLGGIVVYSYSSSQRAFRQVVEGEIRELAEETGGRLDEVRVALDQRLEVLGNLPVRALVPGAGEGDASQVYSDLMTQLGDAEDLVDFFEFTPVSPTTAALPGIGSDSAAQVVPEAFFIYPSKTLAMALEKVQRREVTLDALGISEGIVDQMLSETIKQRWRLDEAELEALEASQAETRALLGREFTIPVVGDDQVLGYLEASTLR